MITDQPLAVQIRVVLLEIEPPIWRRVQVPQKFNLRQLHRVIQAAFGWWDYHLHEFVIGGLRYGDLETVEFEHEDDPHTFDEREIRLSDFGGQTGVSFSYLYDFGDGWEHRVELEALVPIEAGRRYPACIAGARSAPPEDVGGAGGYARYLEIIADPTHLEYRETRRWRGRFDPEKFDLERTDHDVRNAQRANRRIRMRQ